MRRNRLVRVVVMAALALLAGLVGGPLRAQSCADPAAFQFELDLFLADLQQAIPLVETWEPTEGALFRQAVADFEAAADGLDAEDREALCELFQRYPELMAAPGRIDSELSGLAPLNGPEASCLLLTRQQFLAVFISSQVLQGVAAGLETACDATECIPLACKVTCSLALVARILVIPLEAVLEENDYCGKDTHFKFVEAFVDAIDATLQGIDTALQSQVIPPLDAPLSSRASQASLEALQAASDSDLLALDGQAGAIDAELAAQEADRVAFQEASLLQRIEASLQPGVKGRVSLLQLPLFVGGLLEEVREVVADTILANLAAGHDIGRALDFFDLGDQQLNQQEYKTAYHFYREAYRQAVGGFISDG